MAHLRKLFLKRRHMLDADAETGVLPGCEEEDAADGEVSQKHEEPDSRRERVQEGEVARLTTLKHTHRSHDHGIPDSCSRASSTVCKG